MVLVGPFLPFAIWGIEQGFFDRLVGGVQGEVKPMVEGLTRASLIGAAIGLWWVVLSPLAALALRPLRFLLVPLADGLRRRHLVRFGLLGLFVVAACVSFLFLV